MVRYWCQQNAAIVLIYHLLLCSDTSHYQTPVVWLLLAAGCWEFLVCWIYCAFWAKFYSWRYWNLFMDINCLYRFVLRWGRCHSSWNLTKGPDSLTTWQVRLRVSSTRLTRAKPVSGASGKISNLCLTGSSSCSSKWCSSSIYDEAASASFLIPAAQTGQRNITKDA